MPLNKLKNLQKTLLRNRGGKSTEVAQRLTVHTALDSVSTHKIKQKKKKKVNYDLKLTPEI